MKKLNTFSHNHQILTTFFYLAFATLVSFVIFHIIPEASMNISLTYILCLIMISRYTDGYFYGIIASVISIICVNFFFTYPHFQLNFTITGYPITFLVMLGITVSTSTLTTHMKHQASVLAAKEKQLMEADKEKMRANLLRAVSHDLRTPLTSIIGSVSSLLENTETLSEDEKRQIALHIYDDSNWLLNMVENLLSVTRIQNGTTCVKKSLEVVEEVVQEAVTRLKKRMPEAQIEVTVPEDFLMIPMDAMLIEQVIINLLENALVHANSTKPVCLTVSDTPETVSIHVIDYGKGIKEDLLPHIFDGVLYSKSQTADSEKGMGIGLSICKTIIQAHKGTITATNHSEGAEFTFTLPKEGVKNAE